MSYYAQCKAIQEIFLLIPNSIRVMTYLDGPIALVTVYVSDAKIGSKVKKNKANIINSLKHAVREKSH